MCTTLCGPVPPQESKLTYYRRLYVDRDPQSHIDDLMLDVYDRDPAVRAQVAGIIRVLEQVAAGGDPYGDE